MATNVRYIAHMPAEQENRMVSMNVSVPEALRDYAQSRSSRGFGSVSEYVRELIRRGVELGVGRDLPAAMDRGAVGETLGLLLKTGGDRGLSLVDLDRCCLHNKDAPTD